MNLKSKAILGLVGLIMAGLVGTAVTYRAKDAKKRESDRYVRIWTDVSKEKYVKVWMTDGHVQKFNGATCEEALKGVLEQATKYQQALGEKNGTAGKPQGTLKAKPNTK